MRKIFLFLAGVILIVLLELIYLDFKISEKIDKFEQTQIELNNEILQIDTQLTKISRSLPSKFNNFEKLKMRFTNNSKLGMKDRNNSYLFAAADAVSSQSNTKIP